MKTIAECPVSFGPHVRWDYLKMQIRNTYMDINKEDKIRIKSDVESYTDEINRLKRTYDQLILEDLRENDDKIEMYTQSIGVAESNLAAAQKKETDRIIVNSRSNWHEQSEKGTKYFMSLQNKRQAASYINKITLDNGVEISGPNEIRSEIHKYYKGIYENEQDEVDINEMRTYLTDLPQITADQSRTLESDITLGELETALKTCGTTDTSPGPDGIPYAVYKKFWKILGPELLKSWLYSNEVGKLSPDQRYSVITLIPKPGKDASKINNLRPISLTNTDVKIITNTLTNRFATIMPDIINEYQTAYVKGRQITDNNYMIDKLIKTYEILGEDAFLVSLDARKAFDSVSHVYMLEVLKAFGCGANMVKTVKTLYTNLISSVMVNGFKTAVFGILAGVKQGDALSCILFVLCMEPLIRKIQNNVRIETINVVSPTTRVEVKPKVFAYADDLNPMVRNENSIQEVISEYERFSMLSGIYINPDKTEILRIGPQINNVQTVRVVYCGTNYDVPVLSKIKICGIFHPIESEETYPLNITNFVGKLKSKLDMWKPRSLTLVGKILIVKTFAISQLVYRMHTCHIKEEDLILIDRLCYSFIWNSTNNNRPGDKVKRTLLKNEYENGGFKAPCIKSMDSGIKLKKYLRAGSNYIAPVQDKLLSLYGIYSIVNSDYNITMLRKVLCPSIKTAMLTQKKLHDDTIQEILDAPPDEVSQEDIDYMAGQELRVTKFNVRNAGTIQALRRLVVRGICNLGQLLTVAFGPNDLILNIAKRNVISSYPREWIVFLTHNRDRIGNNMQHIGIKDRKYIKTSMITSKVIKDSITCKFVTKLTNSDVANRFRVEDNCEWNVFTYHPSRDTYSKSFNYRVLTGSYTTRFKLHRYRILDDPGCPFCNEGDDDVEHALLECPLSKITWSNLNDVIRLLGVDYELQSEDVIYGVKIEFNSRDAINTIIITIKRILIDPNKNYRILDDAYILGLFRTQLKLESHADVHRIAHKLKPKFWVKWKDIYMQLVSS